MFFRLGLLGLVLIAAAPSSAATITVNGSCTLVDAILAAETDTATGSCPKGSGADEIVLTVDTTLTSVASVPRKSGLPPIATTVEIVGNGHSIERSGAAPDFRILYVELTGVLTIHDATVAGGQLQDNDSGAGIFIEGELTLNNTTVTGHSLPTAGRGAGIVNVGVVEINGGALTSNTIFRAQADTGGYALGAGIYNARTGTLNGVTISDNYIYGYGGGRGAGVINSNDFYPDGGLTVVDTVIDNNKVFVPNTAVFTLTGAAGLFNEGGMTTITGSTISNNLADVGDGTVYGSGVTNNSTGSMIISSTTISGNRIERSPFVTGYGAGLASGGPIELDGVDIVDSYTHGEAAGVWIQSFVGRPTVYASNLRVLDNESSRTAGGMWTRYPRLVLTDSTISGNLAGTRAGGLRHSFQATYSYPEPRSLIRNTTISGNTSGAQGGGILNYGALDLENSTISGNTGSVGGGLKLSPSDLNGPNYLKASHVSVVNNTGALGANIWSDASGNTTDKFHNSIIAFPQEAKSCRETGSGGIENTGGSLSDEACGDLPTTLNGVDPTLLDNGGSNLTHALLSGSSAIGAGVSCTETEDQRGVARVLICDSGAYEYCPSAVASDGVLEEPATLEGCDVFAGPNYVVEGTGSLELLAASRIVLRNGFSIVGNGELRTEIDPSYLPGDVFLPIEPEKPLHERRPLTERWPAVAVPYERDGTPRDPTQLGANRPIGFKRRPGA